MNYENVLTHKFANVRFLFITANTGSIFEKAELLELWIDEFAQLLHRHPSDFIALHCQEIGGKDYEQFMHILDPFIEKLSQLTEITTNFSRQRFYFDSDYSSQKTFTALGCIYFFRNDLPVQQWNFISSSFQPVVNRQIFAGNLLNAQTLRKEKYPRDFFPETKWSRKGFTQTRWSIENFTFDLLNIHLFHDASNIVAAEESPSLYSKCRRNALEFTLKNLSNDSNDRPIPFVIFGDFNFRLDAFRFIEFLADGKSDRIEKIKDEKNDEIDKIIIRNDDQQAILTIGKKIFNLHDQHDSFFNVNVDRIRTFDTEFSSFNENLFEFERNFPPSYPYSEELNEPQSFLRARCPAWCDRILLSHSFRKFFDIETHRPTYDIIGRDVCVGDHKPVYLSILVHPVQGISDLFDRRKSTECSSLDNEKRRLSNVKSDHRTVISRHRFPTTIKQISIRWIRETPV